MQVGGSGVLKKLGKSSILVTDIANEFWCERQMECNYLYGKKYTKEMAKGTAVHAELQNEVYVPLAIEPVTYEDYMFKTAYENTQSLISLRTKGMCREFRIYGSLNGYRLSGQIDEMKVVDGKVRIVERKTTQPKRQLTEVYTRPHRVQVMMYRRMFGDIISRSYSYNNLVNVYHLTVGKGLSEVFKRELHAMGMQEDLIDTCAMFKKMFEEIYMLPELGNALEVVYVDRFSGQQIESMQIEYREHEVNKYVTYALQYWNGERESAPVEKDESWKCKFCKFFGNECKVWWKQAKL
jgi:exonuclease V